MSRIKHALKRAIVTAIAYGLFVEAFVGNYSLLMTHVLTPIGDRVIKLATSDSQSIWQVEGLMSAASVVIAAYLLLSGWVFILVARALKVYFQATGPKAA